MKSLNPISPYFLVLLMFAVNFFTYGQNIERSTQGANVISGQITYLDSPVPNVAVKIKDTDKGTETDSEGRYRITAKPGEILEFSHISLKRVEVMVEDVSDIINIKMAAATNKLDVIFITTTNRKGEVSERIIKQDEVFSTSMGDYDPRKSGYRSDFVDGSAIRPGFGSLGAALDGMFPGVRYDLPSRKLIVKPPSSLNTPQFAIWDVDGVIFMDEPQLDINTIENIRILKSVGSTNRYGSIAAGGVVLVTTKAGNFNNSISKNTVAAEKYQNQLRYLDDAVEGENVLAAENPYLENLKVFNDKEKAYTEYLENIKGTETDFSIHLGIAKMFKSFYNDDLLTKDILQSLETEHSQNPEILKAIAYHYQSFGMKREAIKTYQNIYYLRPNYAQSLRDVANAYIENEQFKRGWRLYMNYLLEGGEVDEEGIGGIIYNEMEYLYYNRKNQTDIKEKFESRFQDQQEFANDFRLVFEWNTSEAEFELEFVNPDMRSYIFDHSLETSPHLITDEKTKGYSSKEYLLEDIGAGQWLVNLTYSGNKQTVPTYFKVTTFYYWGKFNQKSETFVYELMVEGKKIQLLKINKDVLLAKK